METLKLDFTWMNNIASQSVKNSPKSVQILKGITTTSDAKNVDIGQNKAQQSQLINEVDIAALKKEQDCRMETLKLDFTRINSITPQSVKNASKNAQILKRVTTTPSVKNVDTGQNKTQQSYLISEVDIAALKKEQDYRNKVLEVYKEYQKNTMISGQLQTEILKGVKSGENVYNLFLKAVKAISVMTSNDLFYNQVEADINAIYGEGFHHQIPLQNRINDTKKRLELLLKAQKCDLKDDSKERINKAIKAHEEQLSQLLSFK